MEREPEMVNINQVFDRFEQYLRFNRQKKFAELALNRALTDDELTELAEESRTHKMTTEELLEALED